MEPIRCFTCLKVLPWTRYYSLVDLNSERVLGRTRKVEFRSSESADTECVENKMILSDIFKLLGIVRYCCKTVIMCNSQIELNDIE